MGGHTVRRLSIAVLVVVALFLVFQVGGPNSVREGWMTLALVASVPVTFALIALCFLRTGPPAPAQRMIQVGATMYLGDPLTVARGLRKKQMRQETFDLLEQALQEEPGRVDLIKEHLDLCTFLPHPARAAELKCRLAEIEAKLPPR
jgi:hypothetical protein